MARRGAKMLFVLLAGMFAILQVCVERAELFFSLSLLS
jgi:hypothetical protein